jgi:ankyrin repeat protein
MPLSSPDGRPLKDYVNEFGQNLLHLCTSPTDAKELLEAGVDVNGRDNFRQVPLHLLMRKGLIEVVLYLLSQTIQLIDPNAQDTGGTSPLHLAESVEVNNSLLNHPHIIPNIKNNKGITPLMKAVLYPKHKDIVVALLAHPSIKLDELNECDEKGMTALEHALTKRDTFDGELRYTLILDKMKLLATLQNTCPPAVEPDPEVKPEPARRCRPSRCTFQ